MCFAAHALTAPFIFRTAFISPSQHREQKCSSREGLVPPRISLPHSSHLSTLHLRPIISLRISSNHLPDLSALLRARTCILLPYTARILSHQQALPVLMASARTQRRHGHGRSDRYCHSVTLILFNPLRMKITNQASTVKLISILNLYFAPKTTILNGFRMKRTHTYVFHLTPPSAFSARHLSCFSLAISRSRSMRADFSVFSVFS